MAKKSIWKIDPQEKISKTRVLYTGPEKNIHLLKERLKHYKSSDVYPTMSGEYDYQLFFYTTAANDIASITAMAETIFGASVSEYKEKKGIDKKLAIIISGLIALIILFGIYAGYTQYSKVLQQRQAAEQLLKEKEAEELARAAELQKQKEKEEAASAAAAQQAAEEENKEETKEQAPESVEEDKPEETKKEKISKKDEEESVISAQPGFKQPADFSQQIGKILKIIFVDVGQADAIILIMPSRKCYVIDSGDKPKDGKRIIEILQEHKIKEIETLVLTHPHKDHIGGAKYILDNFKVNSVWDAGKPVTSRTYKDILQTVKEKRIRYETPKRGKSMNWDAKVNIRVLHPVHNQDYANINNTSIVIYLKYLNIKFLFMGDLEEEYEHELVKSFGSALKVDGLKVGHHGSRTSSSEEFLRIARPSKFFIQVGEGNKFGHPTPSTLKRLKSFSKDVYRTDEVGDIIVESDGIKMKVTTQK